MTQKTLIPPEFKLTQSSNFSVTLRKGGYGISFMQNNDITSAIKNGFFFSSACQYVLDKLKLFLSILRLWKEKRRTRYDLAQQQRTLG